MPNTTSVYCNSSASVMYISIPPFREGKRRCIPPLWMRGTNRLPLSIAPYGGIIAWIRWLVQNKGIDFDSFKKAATLLEIGEAGSCRKSEKTAVISVK